jgi:hypothetical protein
MDGRAWRAMWRRGLERIRAERATIDALNVFPVPDADTGHNMAATVETAVLALDQAPADTPRALAQTLVDGALRGARGNSGVILSQWMRGFAEAAPDADQWDAGSLRRALTTGAAVARAHVHQPVEGTVLTAMTRVAAALETSRPAEVGAVLETAAAAARLAVEETPRQLDVLARAGVVDAGAYGFAVLLAGLAGTAPGEGEAAGESRRPLTLSVEAAQLDRPYDIEALLAPSADAPPPDAWATRLAPLGDSIVVAEAPDGCAKVHIHTAVPSAVLLQLEQWGRLAEMTILDMRRQVAESSAGPWGVVEPSWNGLVRVLGAMPVKPDPVWDRPGAVWLQPGRPLRHAWAARHLAELVVALSGWWPGAEPEEDAALRQRAAAAAAVQVVYDAGGYRLHDGDPLPLERALDETAATVAGRAWRHLFIGGGLTEEEARRWETACRTEAVRVDDLPVWVLVVGE